MPDIRLARTPLFPRSSVIARPKARQALRCIEANGTRRPHCGIGRTDAVAHSAAVITILLEAGSPSSAFSQQLSQCRSTVVDGLGTKFDSKFGSISSSLK